MIQLQFAPHLLKPLEPYQRAKIEAMDADTAAELAAYVKEEWNKGRWPWPP